MRICREDRLAEFLTLKLVVDAKSSCWLQAEDKSLVGERYAIGLLDEVEHGW
jgi:hypothetical protein